jgi:hypothetical protein
MGTVISFEEKAVANLRARVAAAEEANQDLIAFARGHSGAVHSIHEAVLAAIEAKASIISSISSRRNGRRSLAGRGGGGVVRRGQGGARRCLGSPVRRSARDRAGGGGLEGVVLRGCGRGHPLFGPPAT